MDFDSRYQPPFFQFLRLDGAGVNEVQTLAITGTPTGGTFDVTYDGQTAAAIAYDAAAADVQTALEALSNIAVGDVTCTGGALPGTPVVITFGGLLGLQDVPLATADGTNLTGGVAPDAAIALTTRGIATDEHNMGIDGSSTPQVFGLRPTASQLFVVNELLFTLQDTGAMTAALFAFATALTNGLTLKVLDLASATLYDLFNGEPVKTNADLAKFCTDLNVFSWGAGDEILQARFDLSKSGSPLVIDGAASQTLVATVQDDLTGLNSFTIAARGYRKV